MTKRSHGNESCHELRDAMTIIRKTKRFLGEKLLLNQPYKTNTGEVKIFNRNLCRILDENGEFRKVTYNNVASIEYLENYS